MLIMCIYSILIPLFAMMTRCKYESSGFTFHGVVVTYDRKARSMFFLDKQAELNGFLRTVNLMSELAAKMATSFGNLIFLSFMLLFRACVDNFVKNLEKRNSVELVRDLLLFIEHLKLNLIHSLVHPFHPLHRSFKIMNIYEGSQVIWMMGWVMSHLYLGLVLYPSLQGTCQSLGRFINQWERFTISSF